MIKIRKIQFINHPVMKNLELNFCDESGVAVDTVIIAGENGCGKSTVIDTLYKVASGNIDFPLIIEVEVEKQISNIEYYYVERSNERKSLYAKINQNQGYYIMSDDYRKVFPINGIFSDVDINFHSHALNTVTSLTLDATTTSQRSNPDLPQKINQLIIDIQALDDAQVAKKVRENPDKNMSELDIDERMPRFTNAFNIMFDSLTYSHVDNKNNRKNIVFKKYDDEVSIDDLSSGEKQIVYRGAFLLKDINAISGALVFIDEPEISLHPKWQMKIMDYYKNIFIDRNGLQTSQIFAVTHSPFIIHNDNRKNDKVIVLNRDNYGNIVSLDKPEYYNCNSFESVADGFHINNFKDDTSTVYLEGRTDEMYFKRALEVYDYNIPIEFKWIGYLDDKGNEVNTGEKNIDAAFHFLVSKNLSIKNFCLKDCDTCREPKTINNTTIFSIPKYNNNKNIKKGIENALILDNIDLSPFYKTIQKDGDYGERKSIESFDKMSCCKYICSLENDLLKSVFKNVNDVIRKIIDIYNE